MEICEEVLLLSPAVHFVQLLRDRHPQRDPLLRARRHRRVQQALQAVEGGQDRRRRSNLLVSRQDAGVLVAW